MAYPWVEIDANGKWYMGRNGVVYDADGWSEVLGYLQRLRDTGPRGIMVYRNGVGVYDRTTLRVAIEIVEQRVKEEQLRNVFL